MPSSKFWIVTVMLVIGFSFLLNVARADDPVWNGGGKDPNHVYSKQELQASAKKKALAKRYLKQRKKELATNAMNSIKILNIPEADQLKEKNDFDHRNYCGPAATKIILYTWTLDLGVLPTMNEIGVDEEIDPGSGVFNHDVRDYLNTWLDANVPSYNWDYVESTDSTKADLKNYIIWDIDANRGLESALWTYDQATNDYMPGWASKDVRHINAIRGYVQNLNSTRVHYIEAGQSAQGYSGTFYQNVGLSRFFKHVNAHSGSNNSQVW